MEAVKASTVPKKLPSTPSLGVPKTTPVPQQIGASTQAIPVSKPVPSYAAANKNTTPTSASTSTATRPFDPSIMSDWGKVPTPPPEQPYQSQEYIDWSKKQNEAFAEYEKSLNTPFNYDPNTDATLQSQKALYEAGAAQASQSAMETMNDRGILSSSLTGSQLAQIQQNANTQFNALIPQYRDQAYNQYQDGLRNAGLRLANAMNLRNQQFNEGITEGELTGNYMSSEARQLYNQLTDFKAQTEANWMSMTPEQRIAANKEGDRMRSILTGMGVDVSKIGSDITSNQASANRNAAGVRTLAGEQLDLNRTTDERNFEYQQERDAVADEQWQQQFGITLSQVTGFLPDGTKTSAQQQQDLNNLWMLADQTGKIPDQIAEIYGLPKGMDTFQAKTTASKLAIERYQAESGRISANASSTSAAASMMNANTNAAELAYRKTQGSSSGTGSKSSGYKYDSDPSYSATLQELYQDPVGSLAALKSDPAFFRDKYGADGYNELMKIAEKEASR